MTYDFAESAPIDLAKLRQRLRRMSRKELQAFGKSCAYKCSAKANFDQQPHEDFAIQLEEAREEWKRRMKRPNDRIK